MPVIELITEINAPIERCFDLARNINLHKYSTEGTDEKAIAGVTSGLIGKDRYVTWEAKHFGIKQKLTSAITAFEYPFHFRDEMVKGAFRMIKHDHVLTSYLEKFLLKLNAVIKEFAESERWRYILL